MTHVDHAWRHRPKALGGTDPIEFTSGGVFTTYRDCILADLTTLNLWPCDDASGGLVDIVGSDDMTEIAWDVWPKYGQTGPFTGLPEQTAVANGGISGVATGLARFSCPAGLPATTTPFTLQGWLYATALEGMVWEDWAGVAGQTKALINGPSSLTYLHGNGLFVVGPALTVATWTHIRIDYDGTTMRLLQDDVVIDSNTGSGSGSQGSCFFLNNNNFGGTGYAPFQGRAALWSLHDGLAQTCPIEGEGGSSTAPAGYGPVADGSGGVTWTNIATQEEFDAHVDDATAAHAATAIAITDAAADFTATDVEGALAELQTADEADEAALAAHIADATDAHDASAVSIADAGGYYTGAEVEAALQELGAAFGDVGRWEIVMADGVTAPPVPVETEAQDDWVYVLVED